MSLGRSSRRGLGGVIAGAVVLGSLAGVPAYAIGGSPATDGSYPFVAKIALGDRERSCTGALVDPQWVITARSCFGSAAGPATLGAPSTPTTATVGRTSLAGSAGQVVPIVHLAPHPDRDVVLAKLATRLTGITPVPVGTTAPAAGDVLRLAGYGRTRTEWVPDRLHTATAEVTGVAAATLDIVGQGPEQASPCKGDAGGPALRENAGGAELVALHHTSWQRGCLGEDPQARPGATETRVDDLAGWIRQSVADVTLYGVLPDGRLTYSVLDSASGDLLTTVTSGQRLGFTPKALATMNANTLLVTDTDGRLHRVDITGNNPSLTFAAPVPIGTGWTHERLTYDGHGSLFGIAGSTLRRYTVTSAKPVRGQIIYNTAIGDGFTLSTLTATGPDWILGTTSAGVLRSYRIDGAGAWAGHTLADTGWAGLTHLVSPGDGLYYARTAAGALHRYRDAAPFDGKGGDVQAFPADPVGTGGWNQALLSAQPRTSQPQSTVDVEVYGVLPDGRLTYSAIDSASGDRQLTAISTQTLGFAPRALVTLNFDTLLVTSTAGLLFRVDIVASNPLTFAAPVQVGTGWTHDLLTYDGHGSLFGIADGVLRRYTVTRAKPVAGSFTANTRIGAGFTLTTLTGTGPGWILGTTSAGVLRSYHVEGADKWTGHTLAAAGWAGLTHLLSPGNGVYYGRTRAQGMQRYHDAAPFDGKGTDITSFPTDPVDAQGWNQLLLSARPFSS